MNDDVKKTYIGDGVYASNDGFHIILETQRENGTNIIYLEAALLSEILAYALRIGFPVDVPKEGRA